LLAGGVEPRMAGRAPFAQPADGGGRAVELRHGTEADGEQRRGEAEGRDGAPRPTAALHGRASRPPPRRRDPEIPSDSRLARPLLRFPASSAGRVTAGCADGTAPVAPRQPGPLT